MAAPTIGYGGRHYRVYAARGKAEHCSLRGLTDCTSTNYTWAQIHGTDGLDVREYVSLCKQCHSRYDDRGNTGKNNQNVSKTQCPMEHEYDYVDPKGRRGCRRCRTAAVRRLRGTAS